MLMNRPTRYLLPILICLLVGAAASFFQKDALIEWYPFLFKPRLTPPDAAFPIVWSILYVLIGISMGRIWDKGEPLWGLGIILALDAVVLDYIFTTYKKDKIASICFMPYAAWLLWGTYLNACIYLFN